MDEKVCLLGSPVSLVCEYLENPLGIETAKPNLSWKLTAVKRGQVQSAYRILVSGSLENIQQDIGDKWDTGRVKCSNNVNIRYEGSPLKSREVLYWKVRVWDKEGTPSPFSEVARFEMALLGQDDWTAKWIAADDSVSAPYFRREFEVKKPIRSARAYVTGIGYYEMYLNGGKVGNKVLTPDRTEYTQRVLYNTYDITDLLVQGKNAVGAIVGNGWYNQKDKINVKLLWYGYPKMIAQIHLDYTDGTGETIVSDETWKWFQGPILYNNIYYGEIYDARRELPGWDLPGYDDSTWEPARPAQAPGGRLVPQHTYAEAVIREMKAVKITSPRLNVYVFDMGQNFTGWVKIKALGNEGTRIMVRFGEELLDTGMIDYYSTGCGSTPQKDEFILKGEGVEYYEPRFTWHGFRYVEVTGYPGAPGKEDIVAYLVHNAVPDTGEFDCSNPIISKIQQAYKWSQRSNLHCGVPLDSPHRERQGYGGDAQTTAEAAMCNFDMAQFYSGWINDFEDVQDERTGFVPHTVPNQEGGGGVGWGGAYLIIPEFLHLYYNDHQLIEKHYDHMKAFVDFLGGCNDGTSLIIRNEGEFFGADEVLGEWSTPGEIFIPRDFVNTFFYGYITKLLAQFARVAGRTPDAEQYEELFGKIVDDFNKAYLNRETGQYSIGAQGTEAYAFMLGAVPPECRDKVADFMIRHIEEDENGHLDTGIFGTPYLLHALTEAGRSDVAYKIMSTTTYPSLGNFIMNGATTLWEYWEPRVGFVQCPACHNQPMFGSVSAWFYKKIAGVEPAAPGFEKILIRPCVFEDLTFARAKMETVRGMVQVSWDRACGGFRLYVTIPVNSTAKICLPKFGKKTLRITEHDTVIWDENGYVDGVCGIASGCDEGDYITFEAGSGVYAFEML